MQVPTTCGFPAGTRLAFAGESSLHRLRLGHPQQFDEVGWIYVTAERISLYDERPARRWCLVPPPGSDFGSQDGTVPDHWMPPVVP